MQLLFDKPYEASVPVPAKSPAAFAAAWGQVYRQILSELTADLRNALPQAEIRRKMPG